MSRSLTDRLIPPREPGDYNIWLAWQRWTEICDEEESDLRPSRASGSAAQSLKSARSSTSDGGTGLLRFGSDGTTNQNVRDCLNNSRTQIKLRFQGSPGWFLFFCGLPMIIFFPLYP